MVGSLILWGGRGFLLGLSIGILIGCRGKEKSQESVAPVNAGTPQHWDVGDRIRRNPLPKDMSDGFLQFGTSPHSSYGVTLAHQRISSRNHTASDLIFYVHSGTARFQVGNRSFTAAPGDLIYIPRGYVYSAESLSKQPLELLTIYTPPLSPEDVVYHEPAERVIPGPAGKKLKVVLKDTTIKREETGPTPEEEFMNIEEETEWEGAEEEANP